jgi:uncharacterized protein involved in exopolysaccharide biosynthesis
MTEPLDEIGSVGLVPLANVLLRERRLVGGTVIVLLVLLVSYTLLQRRTYTSTAWFIPQAPKANSALSGLAAQFGIVVQPTEPGQSPAFYVDLVKSRAVLGALADSTYDVPLPDTRLTGRLVDIFHASGRTEALRREALIDSLDHAIGASVVQRTGVVKVGVKTRYPGLSRELLGRTLALVNRFNLETRQSQAAAESRFTERRLGEVKDDLRRAEDQLAEFLKRNRDYRNSPDLSFQQERLTRVVNGETQLYNSLLQAYEQAKIDAVRDTPVITVVVPAELPVRPDPRGLIARSALAILLGLIVGSMLAFGREAFTSPRPESSGELQEFERLRRAALADLARPVGWIARRFRARPTAG